VTRGSPWAGGQGMSAGSLGGFGSRVLGLGVLGGEGVWGWEPTEDLVPADSHRVRGGPAASAGPVPGGRAVPPLSRRLPGTVTRVSQRAHDDPADPSAPLP